MANPIAYPSAMVVELVGITPIYLNALVHRRLYGIKASLSDRLPEGKARIFDEGDVLGIALVWALFQSGLRTQQIRAILNQIGNTREADAKHTARILSEWRNTDCLLVIRKPYKTSGKQRWKEIVDKADQHELGGLMEVHKFTSALVIPMGETLDDLKKRIAALSKEK